MDQHRQWSQVAGLPLSGLKLDLNGGILQLFHAGQARMFSVIQSEIAQPAGLCCQQRLPFIQKRSPQWYQDVLGLSNFLLKNNKNWYAEVLYERCPLFCPLGTSYISSVEASTMYHVSGRPMHHVSFYTVSCLLTIVYHLHPSCHRHNNDLDQDHQRTNIILPNILKTTLKCNIFINDLLILEFDL